MAIERFAGADVTTIADALYGLAPELFVATRNEAAKALRAEKRRDDAAIVAKLTKPTAAAAALNSVARSRPDLIDALLACGTRLRDVQDAVLAGALDAGALRSAGEERRLAARAVVQALTEMLGPDEARRPDEWVRTLEAASTDPSLGLALRRGRVTKLALDGIGLDGLLAGADPVPRHLSLVPPLPVSPAHDAPPSAARSTERPDQHDQQDQQDQHEQQARAKEAARRALDLALEHARDAHRHAEDAHRDATSAMRSAAHAVEEAARAVEVSERVSAEADAEVQVAEAALQRARDAAELARQHAAQARLDALHARERAAQLTGDERDAQATLDAAAAALRRVESEARPDE